MRRISIGIALALLLTGSLAVPATASVESRPLLENPAPLRLGMNLAAVPELAAMGAPADYAGMWAGSWLQKHGWDGFDAQLAEASAAGVVPVVHFWYWGDSISPACVTNGCHDHLQDQPLDQAGWSAMTDALAQRIAAHMGGREVIVILESEFNKNGIDSPEFAPTFDAMLASHAARLHEVPGIRVAVGFGAWNEEGWTRFPASVAASDLLGIQAMRGSTRNDDADYRAMPAQTENRVRLLWDLFGKPVLLDDLALSSHPTATHTQVQAETLRELFARTPAMRATGLEGIVYRTLVDEPWMDPANYFGEAEQHWGFKTSTGGAKPALHVWLANARPPSGVVA